MKSSVSMFLIFLGSPDKIGTIGCYPDAVGMQVRVLPEEQKPDTKGGLFSTDELLSLYIILQSW